MGSSESQKKPKRLDLGGDYCPQPGLRALAGWPNTGLKALASCVDVDYLKATTMPRAIGSIFDQLEAREQLWGRPHALASFENEITASVKERMKSQEEICQRARKLAGLNEEITGSVRKALETRELYFSGYKTTREYAKQLAEAREMGFGGIGFQNGGASALSESVEAAKKLRALQEQFEKDREKILAPAPLQGFTPLQVSYFKAGGMKANEPSQQDVFGRPRLVEAPAKPVERAPHSVPAAAADHAPKVLPVNQQVETNKLLREQQELLREQIILQKKEIAQREASEAQRHKDSEQIINLLKKLVHENKTMRQTALDASQELKKFDAKLTQTAQDVHTLADHFVGPRLPDIFDLSDCEDSGPEAD